MVFLNAHKDKITSLCKIHKVKYLYAFGSVLTENFNSESDVDLIVSFEPIAVLDYMDNYYDLKFSLEATFHKTVDLIEDQAIETIILDKL